jgi:drug/metabolite transporter (DMT)-like permease
MVVLALLGRVLFSAAASTLQKKLSLLGTPTSRLWNVTYLLMAVPALLAALLTSRQPVDSAFWINAVTAGLLDALGNFAMVSALRSTHLSIFGPLNGFRPVLALFFGWIFLGEQPSTLGALGVLVTVVGVMFLLRSDEGGGSSPWRVLALRATGLALSTLAAVFLKRATLASSPAQTLSVWILCGLPVFWLFSRRPASPAPTATGDFPLLLTHAAFFFAMQWLTLLVFRATLLAYSFAFFQLGMVLQVLLGHWIFREPHFARRLLWCAVIGLGALLISLAPR